MKNKEGKVMIEMGIVLLACGILLAVAYELTFFLQKGQSENHKSVF